MSNLPPCGACSYTPAEGTLSITISPKFVGKLHSGRLILRSETGEEITHALPHVLGGGDRAVVKGLDRPAAFKVRAARLAWAVAGDPGGKTRVEQAILVQH